MSDCTERPAIRLIVFDLDGTLVDSRAAIVAAMQETFRTLDRAAPGEKEICAIIGLKLEAALAALLPPDVNRGDISDLSARYREVFVRQRKSEAFPERLFPGVRSLLEGLDKPERFLGIATGKSRRALRVTLDHHGIARHFTTLRSADDGPSKPHPEILLKALDDVGVSPDEAVFVGDTTYDMETARNAGTRAIGVTWGHHSAAALTESGAGRVLNSTEELAIALANMTGADCRNWTAP